MPTSLKRPVGIFDAGIGSYDIVRRVSAAYPRQDILYLADRASFPYGSKTEAELENCVLRALDFLDGLGAESVILASNAPTITVLERVIPQFHRPVLGIYPPIRAALHGLGAGDLLAVIGARVLTESTALQAYVAGQAGQDSHRVVFVEAGDLIDLVESGQFLSDPATTQHRVSDFVKALKQCHPRLAGITLSSTHLPWLSHFFAQADASLQLFDPADEVVARFAPFATAGSGTIVTLVTESPQRPFHEFQSLLGRLSLTLAPRLVQIRR